MFQVRNASRAWRQTRSISAFVKIGISRRIFGMFSGATGPGVPSVRVPCSKTENCSPRFTFWRRVVPQLFRMTRYSTGITHTNTTPARIAQAHIKIGLLRFSKEDDQGLAKHRVTGFCLVEPVIVSDLLNQFGTLFPCESGGIAPQ